MNNLELQVIPDIFNVYVEMEDGREYVSILRNPDNANDISVGTERADDMNFQNELTDSEGNHHEVDGIQYGYWEDNFNITIDTDDVLVEDDGKEYARIVSYDFLGGNRPPVRRP